jgi:peptide/nickel transport system substrate-binding protein
MVADQLAAVGLRVRLDRMDSTRFSSALFERYDFDALLGEDSSGIGLPCGDHTLFSSPTEYHMWFPKQATPSTPWEAEIDRLFRAASLERDPEQVVALLHRFQRIMAEEQPMLFVANKLRSMACRAKLRNFRPAPLEPAVYWTANEMFFAE